MRELPNGPWEHLWADFFWTPLGQWIRTGSAVSLFSLSCCSNIHINISIDHNNSNGQNHDQVRDLLQTGYQQQNAIQQSRYYKLRQTYGVSTRVTPYANATLVPFMRNLGKVLKTFHINDITTGRQPFNAFFVHAEPRCIAPRETYQLSFCSKIDITKLGCRTQ